MPQIHVLDSETIDKIAAGEVVERPASVVKELVENAIDAGADSITVEIKEGGISLIRITDNGSGMPADQLRTAFLRHATSKIDSADDLTHIASLGFRGEALSSISAVAVVEVITKTANALTGTRMVLEGPKETVFEEVGAPCGTTFLIRNLFFNTPVRRKFLKSPTTEAGYIIDLMEHMALSRPDISFKFMVGSQTRFYTSGNGDLREVIYRLYGRDMLQNLVPFNLETDELILDGYLGTPAIVRSNRNFEIYFLNGRYIRSDLLGRAIEEGYREYLMQHKFPLCVLRMTLKDISKVDVNVHPSKMEVRFLDGPAIYDAVSAGIREQLRNREMIPAVGLDGKQPASSDVQHLQEMSRQGQQGGHSGKSVDCPGRGQADRRTGSKPPVAPEPFEVNRAQQYRVMEERHYEAERRQEQDYRQGELFEDKVLTPEKRAYFKLLGQVFDTYWLIEYEDKLLIIDQHAAHEKVKYERLMKQYHEKSLVSQNLMPPIIVSLSGQEETAYREHASVLAELGFEVESFGGNEYALRSVPVDLYGCGEKELFVSVLDDLLEGGAKGDPTAVREKIASMSCKAAVKGNNRISTQEAHRLIDELLTLDNPYNCPHGRPTIISMSKYEMEKKFKR
ncbi:MAG: DNA mismatch repair endonuclease MutL [bacterium]|nr:DNA mismatch repair endonuclease MutL [bacterium]MCM1376593.1 DNA mismatch repair endonuclease MutL [Muribaculum sp.]